MSKPKVSIITVCYNSGKTIEKTIRSVNSQTYTNIEHIFIDGKSTDNTVNIIKKLSPTSKLISEKDSGIYDAMNKGYKVATGDIIGTLNSDDFYLDNNVIQNIVDRFVNNDIDYFCGRIKFFDVVTGEFSHYFGEVPSLRSNLKYMTIAHPTIYVRRELLDKIGLYDLRYEVAADFEWCLRLLKGNFKYYYSNQPIIGMSWGGKSSKNFIISAKEELAIKIRSFPERKNEFTFLFFFYTFGRIIREFMLRVRLGNLVDFLRRRQGKMS